MFICYFSHGHRSPSSLCADISLIWHWRLQCNRYSRRMTETSLPLNALRKCSKCPTWFYYFSHKISNINDKFSCFHLFYAKSVYWYLNLTIRYLNKNITIFLFFKISTRDTYKDHRNSKRWEKWRLLAPTLVCTDVFGFKLSNLHEIYRVRCDINRFLSTWIHKFDSSSNDGERGNRFAVTSLVPLFN